ncbi:MAG: aminotransferase class I/II-fold pyridoxal phosphate-dependent enzyme [Bacilli bacterium]|nr:aminotransferase class I/II-fold pyridoxal phosphate-dependent enzyme [Bacilli bacterium]
MDKKKHEQTPYFTALMNYRDEDVAPFDNPGHKLGRLNNEFKEAMGETVLQCDINIPRGMDTLMHPTGVIKEAQDLMADAFGADHCFFLINGTSVGILAMIMTVVRAKEKIILPRNVHKSAINALILSGAVPVFVEPEIDDVLGIANGVTVEAMTKAILENPDAKAVFVINPTYFGVASNIKEIVKVAHEHKMAVIMDEAHGTHMAFSSKLPPSGISMGADMTTGSIHKTGGSLTQSSILLMNDNEYFEFSRVQATLNMLQSTSPSALLIGSLDVARKHLVLEGEEMLDNAINLAKYACERLNKIPGIQTYSDDHFQKTGYLGHDVTKVIIKVNELGLSGFEVLAIMKDKYHVVLELAEAYVVLAIFSIGSDIRSVERLINAFEEISYDYYGHKEVYTIPKFKYHYPPMISRPRYAFHAPKKFVLIEDAVGEIAGESVMVYPPGIPLVIPGEEITQDFVDMIKMYRTQESKIITEMNNGYIRVIDKDKWEKWTEDDEA